MGRVLPKKELVLVYFMVSNTQPCEATHRQGFESCFGVIQKVNFHCPLISQVIRSYTATQFLHPVRLFKSSNSPFESVWKGGKVHLDWVTTNLRLFWVQILILEVLACVGF